MGNGNVPVLRHRHVPGDTTSPGCIDRKHRGGPLSAQRPGVIKASFSHSLMCSRFKAILKYVCLGLSLDVAINNLAPHFCLCQRCTVDAVDQQGATALHVAAERGGVEVCWTLLQRTGCRMLHQKNHSGLTPLDLSKQGKTFR